MFGHWGMEAESGAPVLGVALDFISVLANWSTPIWSARDEIARRPFGLGPVFSASGGHTEGAGLLRDGVEQRGPVSFEGAGSLALEGLAQRVDVDAGEATLAIQRSAAP